MKKVILFVLVSFSMQTVLAGNFLSKKRNKHKHKHKKEKLIEQEAQNKAKQALEEKQRKMEGERRDKIESNIANSLIEASGRGDTKQVKALLAAGVNPNASYDYGRAKETALYRAAKTGNNEIAKLLLEFKAATESKDCKPLLAAIENAKFDTIKLLLDNNADIDSISPEGDNALTIAAKAAKRTYGHYSKTNLEKNWITIITYLLESGANPNFIANGKTAYDLIFNRKIRDLLALASLNRREKNMDNEKEEEEDKVIVDAPPPYKD